MKNSLHDLYIHELRNLFSAEMQLVDVLAKMSEVILSAELNAVIVEHLNKTIDQLNRLDHIFKLQNQSPRGRHCAPIECLAAESRDLLREGSESEMLDAAMIAIAQKAGHFEIAGYGTAKAYAALLGDQKAEELLRISLEEEKDLDRKLTHLASQYINRSALEAA